MVSLDSVKAGVMAYLPSAAGVKTTITIISFVVLFAAVSAIIAYMVIMAKKYNKKIIIMREIPGYGLSPVGRDTAMLVKIGDGGEQVLYLRKNKIYRTAYGKETSPNTFTFAVGSDGYWYNITFQAIDKKLKEIEIDPIDRDMRYMHVAIRRNMKAEFNKGNWLKDNAAMLIGVGAIIMILIFMWLIADKYLSFGDSLLKMGEMATKMQESTNQILARLDTVQSGGSGLVKAVV